MFTWALAGAERHPLSELGWLLPEAAFADRTRIALWEDPVFRRLKLEDSNRRVRKMLLILAPLLMEAPAPAPVQPVAGCQCKRVAASAASFDQEERQETRLKGGGSSRLRFVEPAAVSANLLRQHPRVWPHEVGNIMPWIPESLRFPCEFSLCTFKRAEPGRYPAKCRSP